MSKYDKNTFVEGCKDLVTATEILNWYRNLYHKEPELSEQHVVAMALNDILPEYVKLKLENENLKLKLDGLTATDRNYVKVIRMQTRREFAVYVRRAIKDRLKDYESLLSDVDGFISEFEEADEIG